MRLKLLFSRPWTFKSPKSIYLFIYQLSIYLSINHHNVGVPINESNWKSKLCPSYYQRAQKVDLSWYIKRQWWWWDELGDWD